MRQWDGKIGRRDGKRNNYLKKKNRIRKKLEHNRIMKLYD